MNKSSNRNWTIIVLILVFILGYEWLVVRPQLKQQILATQTTTETTQVSPNSPALPSTPSTQPLPVEKKDLALTPEVRAAASKLPLTNERFIRVFPNGGLGDAEFADYTDRAVKDQPVRLDTSGWFWTSNDPNVADCLRAVAPASSGSESVALFKGGTGYGLCEIRYESLSAQKPGLLKVSIQLEGFPETTGYAEFSTVAPYGKALDPQDHRNLGYVVDGSRTWVKEKDLLESKTVQGRFDWVAWGDKYFGTILMPQGQFNPNAFHQGSPTAEDAVQFGLRYPLTASKEKTKTFEFSMYVGTRSPEVLSAVDPRLVDALDYGWFGSVARALLWLLKKIHLLVANWGLSIIVLTLLVRVAFWPLNKKVYSSGQQMKLVQPEMERIKAKYGSDRSKADQMNREVMELYRKHKVNPLGGCLPVLAQMPIFIGLWSALSHAIELYQTQFLWIHDLSSKDPYYIFPALWTATLLIYSRLTPQPQSQPGMPDMKWVMIIMNLVFGFLSKDWPAGLTLYLFVSNLVGITQQWLFQRAAKLQPIREGA